MRLYTRLSLLFVLTVFFQCVCTAQSQLANVEVEKTTTRIEAEKFSQWRKDVSLNFCVISDPHAYEPVRKGYEQFGTAREKFSMAVDHINSLAEQDKPGFVLVTGDVYLDKIKDIVDQSGLKFYFVAGNHEKVEDKKFLRESYPEYFQVAGDESDYYSFTADGCRFIGICDAAYPEHVGSFSSEQIIPFGQAQWIESELKKSEEIKIVFGHIPPHPDSGDSNMYMSRNDSVFFNELVEMTSPSLMFFGHQHHPTRKLTTGNTEWFIVRSLSWNAGNAAIGYLSVKLDGSGAEIDEYTFVSSAPVNKERPQFSFGIVADIQYADRADVPATNSYYRSSPSKLSAMVEDFNGQDLAFAIQLGDIIDSVYKSYETIYPIWQQVAAKKYNVVGNHDFVPDEVAAQDIYKKLGIAPKGYYDFSYGNIRFVVLNTSDVSLYANKPGTEKYIAADEMLKRLKSIGADGAHSWGGAVGAEQLIWLETVLADSKDKRQETIIFTHHPLIPHALWNWREVYDVLVKYDNVAACIAGHIHEGYYRQSDGIEFITVQGMVANPEENSYAIADVYEDRIEIRGFGRESDFSISLLEKVEK
ncbi:MAG: metallophosphoesterase [Sedimentisphaeraceae bacterium JB056]